MIKATRFVTNQMTHTWMIILLYNNILYYWVYTTHHIGIVSGGDITTFQLLALLRYILSDSVNIYNNMYTQ